jgi:hypothetical protein
MAKGKNRFHEPLLSQDAEDKTVGCRHTNPDICAKHSLATVCAFARKDGMCTSPPSTWPKQFRKLRIRGEVLPGGSPGTGGRVEFRGNDAGYLRWLVEHPEGFVLNAEVPPTSSDPVLHRATCGTINGRPARGSTWTAGTYSKVVADKTDELVEWARVHAERPVRRCEICRP